MTNVLEFRNVLMKKNRKERKIIKKKEEEKAKFWTLHFEERLMERKVSKKLVSACLKKGRVLEKDGVIHYILENLHVIVDRSEESLITAYFRNDFSEEQEMMVEAA